MADFIPGGHFLLSRLIYESAIWRKKPFYLKLFIWLIGHAAYRDGHIYKGHILKRGELVTTYDEITESLAYTFNRAITKPSIKELRVMLEWLQSEGMISVKPLIDGTSANKGRPTDLTRAYLGLLISIVNYDIYQEKENYKGIDKGRPTSEQGQLREINREINKKTPEEIFSQISLLKEKYSDQDLINQVFKVISSTRKTNRVSDSVKLNILQQWDKYPVNQVMAGIKIYLEKDYVATGKDEKYLLGIIRSSSKQTPADLKEEKTESTSISTCPRCHAQIPPQDRFGSGCIHCATQEATA